MPNNYFHILGCIGILVLLFHCFFYLDRILIILLYGMVFAGAIYGFYRYSTSKGDPDRSIPTRNEMLTVLAFIALLIAFFFIGVINRILQVVILAGLAYLGIKIYNDYNASQQQQKQQPANLMLTDYKTALLGAQQSSRSSVPRIEMLDG